MDGFTLTSGQSTLEPTILTVREEVNQVQIRSDSILLISDNGSGGTISNDMFTGLSIRSTKSVDISTTGGNLTFNHAVGTPGHVLTSQGSGNPVWAALPGPWVPRGVYDPTWAYELGDMVYFKIGPYQSQGLFLRQADPGVLDVMPGGGGTWLTIFLYVPDI